ncbi:hypothetical protein [Ralstonia sp. 25mfcol4.1]|uniref:hypothetical protein n=1 Tax=Ralstonia sp. 25mfcol4.1 TaxID=1761899 RepID=UPI0011135446|nr:hypothetical protein [Ralstonia sp. 25mfcol4.1]
MSVVNCGVLVRTSVLSICFASRLAAINHLMEVSMKSRFTVLLTAIVVAFGLTGCGGGEDDATAVISSQPGGSNGATDAANPNTPVSSSLSWSAAVRLSTAGAKIDYPAAAIAADGFAVAAYVAESGTDGGRVYVATRQPQADSWSLPIVMSPMGQKPVRITPASGWAPSSPAIQVALNRLTGDAVFVWASQADAAFPGQASVWMARYTRAANMWVAPVRLGYATTMPAVSSNRRGDIAVVWAAPGSAGNSVLQGRMLAGGQLSSFGGVDAGSRVSAPQVVLDASGEMTIAWRTASSGAASSSTTGSQLNVLRATATNMTRTPERVLEDTGGDIDFSLAGAESGAAVLGIGTSTGQIMTTIRASREGVWTAPERMQGSAANYLPAVAIGKQGDAVLMFSAVDSVGASYYQRTPWVARYTAATGGWTAPRALSTSTAGVGQPQAHLNDDGSALLSMRGTNVMTWRATADTWQRTTHDLTGTAPVTAVDPESGRAVLLWVGDRVAVDRDGLMAQVLR